MIWNKDRYVPLEPFEQKENYAVYKFPSVPCRLLVTTAEKKQFDVTVLAETKDGGIVLEYHAAAAEAPAGAAAAVTDHERLEGVWKLSSAKNNGRALPEKDGQFVFKSGLYTIFEDGKEKEFGTYTIDPFQNPKTIDLHDASKKNRPMLQAIYEFPREGRLRICGGDNKTGRPTFRPTNFDSVPGINNLSLY